MRKEDLADEPASELELMAQKIAEAKFPEDVFGVLPEGGNRLKLGRSLYLQLCRKVHPNAFVLGSSDEALANTAFVRLHELWEKAEEKLKAGTYGDVAKDSTPPGESVIVKANGKEYKILDLALEGEISNSYCCSFKDGPSEARGIFKVVRDPGDNDLIVNEARLISKLKTGVDFDKFHKYFPRLIDSFLYRDKSDPTPRQVNVFQTEEKLYSLEEIHNNFPGGLYQKDMAWMWRRLLVGLGYVHNNQVIHGAILPPFIFIQPEKHGLVLNEWSYGVVDSKTSEERISAISQVYEKWYPEEVFKKELPTPDLDIFLGARAMVYLLGGDPLKGTLPDSVDRKIRLFFKGCMLPSPSQRPQNAWALMQEFDELIEGLWGPKTFRPFVIPKRNSSGSFR